MENMPDNVKDNPVGKREALLADRLRLHKGYRHTGVKIFSKGDFTLGRNWFEGEVTVGDVAEFFQRSGDTLYDKLGAGWSWRGAEGSAYGHRLLRMGRGQSKPTALPSTGIEGAGEETQLARRRNRERSRWGVLRTDRRNFLTGSENAGSGRKEGMTWTDTRFTSVVAVAVTGWRRASRRR